jgi:hypothetical protein
MERQFNNGDFEKLLRDNANQYRMYPSEKVWKGIHSALHTRRRWYGLTAGIMLLITGSIVSIIIYNNKPGKNNLAEQKSISIQNNSQQQIPATTSKETKEFTPAISETSTVNPRTTDLTRLYLNEPVFDIASTEDKEANVSLNNNLNNVIDQQSVGSGVPEKIETIIEFPLFSDLNLLKQNTAIKTEAGISNIVTDEKAIADQGSVDDDTEKKITDAVSALASQNLLLPKQKKQPKITAQVYFTPTVSYRKLTENKRVYSGSGFYVPSIDVNNLVKHKPAMGLEFGIEGRYQVSEKFSVKTGLQFNINRYDIRAYSHPTEIATVALTSGFGVVDSLASLSNYRNFNGTSANWLENFYFQVAVPVGVEYILSDKKDIQWGISGTIQPTYTIGDRAYVISSDYKNYAKFPDLMRRWNISTGVETFVAYSTGKIKWQVGPHVRYQHLSSFVSALTVKENLFAIGLKVGATLNYKK